jgi:hypothetical protein
MSLISATLLYTNVSDALLYFFQVKYEQHYVWTIFVHLYSSPQCGRELFVILTLAQCFCSQSTVIFLLLVWICQKFLWSTRNFLTLGLDMSKVSVKYCILLTLGLDMPKLSVNTRNFLILGLDMQKFLWILVIFLYICWKFLQRSEIHRSAYCRVFACS